MKVRHQSCVRKECLRVGSFFVCACVSTSPKLLLVNNASRLTRSAFFFFSLLATKAAYLTGGFEEAVAFELVGEQVVEFARGCHVERRLGVAVEQRRIGAVGQQQRADLAPALGRGLVQRRELPQVHGVDIGSVVHQQLGHLEGGVRVGWVGWRVGWW